MRLFLGVVLLLSVTASIAGELTCGFGACRLDAAMPDVKYGSPLTARNRRPPSRSLERQCESTTWPSIPLINGFPYQIYISNVFAPKQIPIPAKFQQSSRMR
jgi:hypothetical protein